MKVYGWMGFRAKEIDEQFPETDTWRRQTREICAAPSIAAVMRATGLTRGSLTNISTTGNDAELAQALSEPGVVFWQPLDQRDGRWARGN